MRWSLAFHSQVGSGGSFCSQSLLITENGFPRGGGGVCAPACAHAHVCACFPNVAKRFLKELLPMKIRLGRQELEGRLVGNRGRITLWKNLPSSPSLVYFSTHCSHPEGNYGTRRARFTPCHLQIRLGRPQSGAWRAPASLSKWTVLM